VAASLLVPYFETPILWAYSVSTSGLDSSPTQFSLILSECIDDGVLFTCRWLEHLWSLPERGRGGGRPCMPPPSADARFFLASSLELERPPRVEVSFSPLPPCSYSSSPPSRGRRWVTLECRHPRG
jgi:hypothetical protein